MNKLLIILFLSWQLTSCGGGGGGGSSSKGTTAPDTSIPDPSTISHSVTVIDGYLQSAAVWIDLNDNGEKDVGEPEAMTGEGGVAVLELPYEINWMDYPVLAYAKAGLTFDESLGSVVDDSFYLAAPAGGFRITPLTTLVYLKIKSGLSEIEARDSVSNMLNTSWPQLYMDFIELEIQALETISSDLVRLKIMPESNESLLAMSNQSIDVFADVEQYMLLTGEGNSPNYVIRDSLQQLALDTDEDGIANNEDDDIDNDGIPNEDDGQPLEMNDGSETSPYILSVNQALSGSVQAEAWQYFKVVSAPDTMLNITLSGLSNDVDLYVSEGEIPDKYSYHCRSNNSFLANETCLHRVEDSTLYYIAVYSRENAVFQILAKNQEVIKKKAILLLHGLASEPSTWSSVVHDDSFFNGSCLDINYETFIYLTLPGSLYSPTVPSVNKDGIYCFNLEFGFLDRGSNYSATGLDQKVCNRALGCNGDYTTFEGLAVEVESAVSAIAYLLGRDTEVFLFGHSRGGLAARAYLQSDNLIETELVPGIATIGTPHQGSPLGRIYKYMNDNCVPKSFYRQDGSKCEDNWETIEMLAGERTFLGYNYNPEYNLDIHAPSIDYLSPDSTSITNLNENVLALRGKVLGSVSYEGTPFGIMSRDAGISNFYDLYNYGTWFTGDHPHPSLLTYVENGQTRESYFGDGIVPGYSQRFVNVLVNVDISMASLAYNGYQPQINILHTEETSRVTDISWLFDNIYSKLDWKE